MVVRIEETRHDSAPAEIDRARGSANLARVADLNDATVLDRQRGSDLTAPVDEFAVREKQIGLNDVRAALCSSDGPVLKLTTRDEGDAAGERAFEQIPS
jgi:hypothetical protein